MSLQRSEPPPGLALNVRGGARVCVPRSFTQITPYTLLEQEDWFESEIRFVRRWLRPGMRVVDVGANYGVYTLAAARAVGGAGRVWAFEPTPESARYLQQSLAMNGAGQVSLERLAISDRAGEVHFGLTDMPEQNAILENGAAPNAVALPAARLDDLAEAGRWGAVDFIKLDVEGHETQALRGAAAILSEHSPLVMLEIRAGKDFDLRAPEMLASMGYSTYRLLPGPLFLVPWRAGELLDRWSLNIFACKDDRARRLAADGFLAEPIPSAAPPVQAWADYASAAPYARSLGQRWRLRPGFLASSADKAHYEGLAAFAISRDGAADASRRGAALSHALDCARRAVESDPSLAKQLSYARIAWEMGQRDSAVDVLFLAAQKLESEAAQLLHEPFLAPDVRYDDVPARDRPSDWVKCAVIESLEKRRTFSSLFVRETVHEVLQPIMELPFRSAEMDRRWQLARMADGGKAEAVPGLAEPSEENLNPEFWRQAAA